MYDLEIALSGDIDDGREDLERCLRPLAEMLTTLDIPMTIPVVAEALQQHPRKIERLRDAGIEIAGHGDIHQPFVGPVGVQGVANDGQFVRSGPQEAVPQVVGLAGVGRPQGEASVQPRPRTRRCPCWPAA